MGCAMDQAVSHRPLTVENWVKLLAISLGIYGVRSCTFSPSTSVLPQQHSNNVLYSLAHSLTHSLIDSFIPFKNSFMNHSRYKILAFHIAVR